MTARCWPVAFVLTPEHHARDLRRVGEVVEPGLRDPDARLRDAILELFAERVVDDLAAAQGDRGGLVVLAVVVGILACQRSHRRVALELDEVLAIVDVDGGAQPIVSLDLDLI